MNHTEKHMKAWFEKKKQMKRDSIFPNKKQQALANRLAKETDEENRKKQDNPLNKPYVKEEGVPTNAMGLSSSTSGPVQTYDPLLGDKDKRKKRIKDMWRRMLNRE